MQNESKKCNKCGNHFSLDIDDLNFYEKMKVPTPNVCPDCRFMMRAMFRNETTLYSSQKCELCGKALITMYNPKLPYKLHCYNCFYSEKWNPKDYAMDYNFERPFMEQLKDLLINVPKISTYMSKGDGENINSDYVNMASGCKNCYLVFNTSPAEELMYSRGIKHGRESSDLYFGTDMERCYECINIQQSSGVIYGQNIISCVNSYIVFNCSGLTDCFGCVNLRNKSNCWFNEQLSREEYQKRLKEVLGSYEKFEESKQKFEEFKLSFPKRENNNLKTIYSTGDYLFECKNVKDSFEISKSEDSKYAFSSKGIKDSLGTTGYGAKSERLLEVVATGFSSNVIGTYGAENCTDILYSFYISNCHDCIGCDSLKNSKYCILNKEYSKEEYEKIKDHIEKELTNLGIHGLMMPSEIAPFAYNETIAQDNMPLTKDEALKLGFKWEDDIQVTTGKETLIPEEIPDHIKDVDDNITNEILRCVDCKRNYRIIEQELILYRKLQIPIPRKCFYCRHQDRIKRRGPYKFWDRKCSNCDKDIRTNYSPDRPDIVFCESCYQKEVM
jgi:hypothetical protein